MEGVFNKVGQVLRTRLNRPTEWPIHHERDVTSPEPFADSLERVAGSHSDLARIRWVLVAGRGPVGLGIAEVEKALGVLLVEEVLGPEGEGPLLILVSNRRIH